MPARTACVRVCGPLLVEFGARRLEGALIGRKAQLFAYLAINRSREVRREELIDALWSADLPQRPERAFATVLNRTRTVLGHHAISGVTHFRLDLGDNPWIDWEVARSALESAAGEHAGGDADRALAIACEALEIVDRGLLPAVEAAWVDQSRRTLTDLRAPLAGVVARAALRLGEDRLPMAEKAARSMVEIDPFRDDGYGLLMEALSAGGNDAEALRTYDQLRTVLREELGVTPAPAVTALAERLLRRENVVELDPGSGRPAASPEPPAPELDQPVAFPFAVAAIAERPMTGRSGEQAALLRAAVRVSDGAQQIMLVSGEPGIGKTRLCVCVARQLHRQGWNVLYGRADRESPVTYQAVLEALQHYVAQRPDFDPSLRELLGPELAELSRRIPALRRLISGRTESSSGDAELERCQMFEAVAALFASATADRPTLLILEDLHWADRSSLLLLRHVIHSTIGCRLFLLGTFRDADADAAFDADAGRPLREFLDDLWHAQQLERLALSGLDMAETEVLVRRELPHAETGLVARLHERTNGNPFFMEETLRGLSRVHASASGAPGGGEELPIPESVTQMIEWRVERLRPPAPTLLKAAAVLGPEFNAERAAALAGCSAQAALDVLEDARRGGLVVADSTRLDHYAFRHALVREALHEATAPGHRARLHLAAGALLESRDGDGDGADPAELAVHFSHAREVGGASRAVHWRLAAAREATGQHADEEAVDHYERALQALEHLPDDQRLRACILMGQGRALVRAGEFAEADERLIEAAELARLVGAADVLADCVLDAGAFYLSSGTVETELTSLLEEALAGLRDADDDADLARRARLSARLAVALYWDPAGGNKRERLAEEAIELARRTEDAGALALAVGSRHCVHWVSERAEPLLAEADSALGLAQRSGEEEFELVVRTWRVNHLLALGRVDEVDDEIDRFVALADRLRQSRCVWYAPLFLGLRALMDGRFDDAEREITAAAMLGGRVPGSTAGLVAGAQFYVLRRLQGRLDELEEAMSGFAEAYPAVPAWTCALISAGCERGSVEASRLRLDEFMRDEFDTLPHDNLWLVAMALLAESCAATGALEHAATVERALEPAAGLNVIVPTAAWLGPVDRVLGLLASVQGRRQQSADYFERAALGCREARSPALLVLVQLDHAEMLLAQGSAPDVQAARALARAALTVAEATGMGGAARRALTVLAGDAAGGGERGERGDRGDRRKRQEEPAHV